MKIQAHWIRNDLHAIVKRAIPFDVDMFLAPVGDSKYFVSIVTILTCSVNLKFYTEIPLRITIEDRLRFISVIVYTTTFINFFVLLIIVILAVSCIVMLNLIML